MNQSESIGSSITGFLGLVVYKVLGFIEFSTIAEAFTVGAISALGGLLVKVIKDKIKNKLNNKNQKQNGNN